MEQLVAIIDQKITKLRELHPHHKPGFSESCRTGSSGPEDVADKFLIESTEAITACVGLLIQQVAIVDRLVTQQLSARDTSANDNQPKEPDAKLRVADNLIQRISALSNQAMLLKEALTKTKPKKQEHLPWNEAAGIAIIVLFFSLV